MREAPPILDQMRMYMTILRDIHWDNNWVQDVEGIYDPLVVAQVRVVMENLRDTGWEKN